jgi:hypothetical protein
MYPFGSRSNPGPLHPNAERSSCVEHAVCSKRSTNDAFSNREAKLSSSRRARLRLRYGYALAVVIALGLIGGTIAVVQNHGRVPDASTTSIGQAR